MPTRTAKKKRTVVNKQRKNTKLSKVAQHADFLSLIKRSKNKKQRDKLVELANKSQIDSISEIIINVLRGTIALSRVQQGRLQRYKNCLRMLALKSTPLHQKKKQLKSYAGGFLPALIGLAAPIISSLVGAFVGKR